MIETERLNIVPLATSQLRLWAEDIPALEDDLNCSYHAEPMEGAFLEIVRNQREIASNDEANFLFHTFWFLIRREDRTVVGSACFKGLPNDNNEVEIGYGLGAEFEHNGYMTEAIRVLCDWALAQEAVVHVIAETDIESPQSESVLTRCGFERHRQGETLWWRL